MPSRVRAAIAVGVLLSTLLVCGVLVAWMVLHYGAFARDSTPRALARIASKRGYALIDDGAGFRAVIDGVAIDARTEVVPTEGGHVIMGSLCATALERAPGRLDVRPKYQHEPAMVRVGDLEFDTFFRIEASSRELACAVLDEEARRALLAFGPRGETSYRDGEVRFRWELRDSLSADELDEGVALVHALCRARHVTTPYRS